MVDPKASAIPRLEPRSHKAPQWGDSDRTAAVNSGQRQAPQTILKAEKEKRFDAALPDGYGPASTGCIAVSKPRLLDLYCGAGGAAVGLDRAGFEVVGVDNKMPQL